MDVIDTIKRNKAYIKCKSVVKNWEKDFKIKNSRLPSKFDIKEAPASIKYAYKKYFQLKSAALENTLSISENDDESIKNLESFDITDWQHETEKQEGSLQDLTMPILPSGKELETILQRNQPCNNDLVQNKFTENLSKKLFHNRTFSLRNPRSKINLSKSLTQSTMSDFDDSINGFCRDGIYNESCLSNQLQLSNTSSASLDGKNEKTSQQTNNELCQNPGRSQSLEDSLISNNTIQTTSVRQINSGWLQRALGSSETLSLDTKRETQERFGLSNVHVPQPNHKNIEYVENSESEEDNICLSKLKPALKKRKVVDETTDKEKICDYLKVKGVKGKKNSTQKYKKGEKTGNVNPSTTSNDVEEPPDITTFLPFGLKERVYPRHSNVTDILKTVDTQKVHDVESFQNIAETKLNKKIETGTLNDNYVRINIEKKVYARGKKSIKYSKYKKQLWKDKKALHSGMEFPESGKVTCFKCGLGGHMARYCTAHKENLLLPLNECDDSDIPSLDDMEKLVTLRSENTVPETELHTCIFEGSKIPDSFLKLLDNETRSDDIIQPILSHPDETAEELHEALKLFGHTYFRPGQEKAIKRILCGMSTLLILSTGGGKSLCYQLPAYLYSKHYNCITLVISPLVSLMEDQVLNMPEFLKAGCLHTNQPPTQRKRILELLKDGQINILLISPEALISSHSSNEIFGIFRSLPKIAFACIDEAHCVSQWSHNFRPSYLMICRVLQEKLNVKCILGLTATASKATINSVIEHLKVPDKMDGVVINPSLPNNLYLSMSIENDKDKALIALLTSCKFNEFSSIIIYCIRRNECERIAGIIRSCLSQPGKVNMEPKSQKRKRMSYIAEAYHAGMSAAQRKKIQKHFMDGTLKIIVATVAFGMGINKSDIRCIIHYNMPPSFESYVQEVGRAGRDGQAAYCHMLMSKSNGDKNELLKHIYSNSIDRPMIRKLLEKVFIPCKCATNNTSEGSKCMGHEVGIPIESTVEELDLPSENIATLLCYVELHPKKYIKVLNNANIMCKISSYGGPVKISEAAKNCPPLAMAYLIEGKRNPDIMKHSVLEFNVIEIAAAIGWDSGMAKYHLKNLEWIVENGKPRKSLLKVDFHTLGFKILARGDLNATELDDILNDLHQIVIKQENQMLHQLEEIHDTFNKLCSGSCEIMDFSENSLQENSNKLKSIIYNYFNREENLSDNITLKERPLDVEQVTADVRSLIAIYKDCSFTGRSVARIFQGISSPNYPALVWGRCKYWRSHLGEDFYGIVKIATQQIIQMKMS